MRTVVKKWRNSSSVRIPAAIMQAARLNLDELVDVREESGRIVIEPAQGQMLETRAISVFGRWYDDYHDYHSVACEKSLKCRAPLDLVGGVPSSFVQCSVSTRTAGRTVLPCIGTEPLSEDSRRFAAK